MRPFDMVDQSEVFRVIYMDDERFEQTKVLFLKHLDQGYSFTDCSSFILMRELEIHDVLTNDRHFQEIGFNAMLIN